MVCKEDVVTWFQRLNAHKRIDVMCSLLDMCMPLELRFLGTCLEDLGKRDFNDLRATETKANDLSELSELQCLSDKLTRRKVVVYLSLLRSCNYACSNGLNKILASFHSGDIKNHNPGDESPLDDLLLLYTLAINHPAFTFEQRINFEHILDQLQNEEHKVHSTKTTPGHNIELLYLNSSIQPCTPLSLAEDRPHHDASMPNLRSTPLAMPPTIPLAPELNKNRCSFPPGLRLPPGLDLPPEQLPPAIHIPVAYPSPSHQPLSSVTWQGGIGPVMIPSLCGEVQSGGETSLYPTSPSMSRPSSPSQSGSPSRAGSPQSAEQSQGYSKGTRRSERNSSLSNSRQNSIDTGLTSSQSQVRSISQNFTIAPEPTNDVLQETIGKEMPTYLSHLQNYSIEELRSMREEELRDLGLSSGAINQLRSIVTKLQNTNGIRIPDKREPFSTARRKRDVPESEACDKRTQANPFVRSFPALPMEGTRLMFQAPPGNPYYSCIAVPARYQNQPPQLFGVNHNLHHLHLDSNSSSGSTSSSASQSPPETPSATSAPNWDRGFSIKEPSGEVWNPSCDDQEDKERLPDANDAAIMVTHQPTSLGRPRLPGCLGRSKANPPGLQTIARGRGPKPVTVILEGNQKTLPSCRRDGTIMNGTLPRTSHPPLSLPSTSQPPPSQYPGNNQNNPSSRPGDGGNVPYNPATPYLSHSQFHPLRTTGSMYTNYLPSNYIRPAFPFPNGEIVYQYHGPQTPPPPPPTAFLPSPVPTYSSLYPPQMCCYNCGQGHHASECKDPTMEEVAKPGQYRLDYTPHQRSGECLSEK